MKFLRFFASPDAEVRNIERASAPARQARSAARLDRTVRGMVSPEAYRAARAAHAPRSGRTSR